MRVSRCSLISRVCVLSRVASFVSSRIKRYPDFEIPARTSLPNYGHSSAGAVHAQKYLPPIFLESLRADGANSELQMPKIAVGV